MPALNEPRKRQNYGFTFVLDVVTVCSEDMAEAIYEAGGDDATVGSREGQVFVHFDRESTSLDAAIASAAAVLRKAGYEPAELTIDREALAALTSSSS